MRTRPDQAEYFEHRSVGQRTRIGVVGASPRLTSTEHRYRVVHVANGGSDSAGGRHSPSQTPSTANFW